MNSAQPTTDAAARRNAFLLAVAQALYSSSTVILITNAGLVGSMLASDQGLATLPASTFVIGTALSTVPASLLMGKIGRRLGFLLGALIGLGGALLAAYAILVQSFEMFCIATLLCGSYQAFGQYYRFAVVDTARESFKAKAISWVMIGGVASAFIGPFLVMATRDLFAPVLFAGCFVASAGLTILAMGILSLINIPHVKTSHSMGSGRPLSTLLRQPRLIAAIVAGMMSYGMMNFVMTSTPIAMVGCGLSFNAVAFVIQWHVLAMYVPSFFTGHLINRFGAPRVMTAGMLLLTAAATTGVSGIGMGHFTVGLILLGVGWNFGFVGATTMVTDCYRSEEKNKVQAVNDFAVFTTVAIASLSSGKLLSSLGWTAVNLAIFPMVLVVLAMLFWLKKSHGRGVGREVQ